jgi:hypothetical protein
MATFPTPYEAQRNIGQTGQPVQAPLVSEGMKAAQQLDQTVTEIGQELSAAHDAMQVADAKKSFGSALERIKMAAAADGSLVQDGNGEWVFKDNSSAYLTQIETAKANALGNIDNKAVSDLLGAEFGLNANIESIKIAAGFRAKELEFNKSKVPEVLEMNQKTINDPNSTEWQIDQARAAQKGFLDLQVATGVLTVDEANTALQEARMNTIRFDIQTDMSTSEEGSIVEDLQDPKGKYSYLTEEERLKLLKEAQARIAQNIQNIKKVNTQSQKDRNSAFVQNMIEGSATFMDLENELSIPESEGGIPRSTLRIYRDYMLSKVDKTLTTYLNEKMPDAKTKTKRSKMASEYVKLINDYMNPSTEYWEAKRLLAEGLRDGLLDEDELKILEPLKDKLKDIRFNKETGFWNAAFKKFNEFMGSQNKSSEDLATDIKNIIYRVNEGETVTQAVDGVITEEMLKHFPDIESYPKEGKRFYNEDGRPYLVFPDNTWKWENVSAE